MKLVIRIDTTIKGQFGLRHHRIVIDHQHFVFEHEQLDALGVKHWRQAPWTAGENINILAIVMSELAAKPRTSWPVRHSGDLNVDLIDLGMFELKE